MTKALKSTRDEKEIAHFAQDSRNWWDRDGPFSPLHRLTPARMRFLKGTIGDMKGKSILDIGCGGGLTSEPLARLGAKVTAVDADKQAITVARAHAATQNLTIDYIAGAAEDLVSEGKKFDVVLALEIIEHVSDPRLFVELVTSLVKPGGIIIFSTLNRTWKSYALGIIAAERVIKWVPPGTHDWHKFVKPSELARLIEAQKFTLQRVMGLVYKPLSGAFTLEPHDLDVNYFLVATAPATKVK